jgi:hypothetical protein
VDRLASICEGQAIKMAVDEALQGLIYRYSRTFGRPGDIR